ncbi:hypothetical protein PoB_006630200 [Plakobranchus ocellatus]|uniref:Uncharacterized protein n=1 Tax=Plakobranchus ocellatus TaxID=259542 RepID=A0AAV4D6G6_9GAST|nr:hypothetical protein PoB_006630200 [Plakobranchus ocellatus]
MSLALAEDKLQSPGPGVGARVYPWNAGVSRFMGHISQSPGRFIGVFRRELGLLSYEGFSTGSGLGSSPDTLTNSHADKQVDKLAKGTVPCRVAQGGSNSLMSKKKNLRVIPASPRVISAGLTFPWCLTKSPPFGLTTLW